jgi:Ca-activated chloride channel family protein
MTFAYPWLLVAPLLYLVIRLLRREPKSSVSFPSASFLAALPKSARQKLREPVLNTLTFIAIAALSVAAARPQKIMVVPQGRASRNIVLVVDASNSMSARDFPTSLGQTTRMEGLKATVAEYVRSRSRDRLALVVFGNTAYLQSPLTSDTGLVEELVKSIQPRMAGDGTAIGDGLGLALKRLREVKEGTRAIILMTDGVNTAGQVSPIKAAHIAKDLGIQIHTIGIGVGAAPIFNQPLGGMLGAPLGPMADFDEKTLKEIATMTGGSYFNASTQEGIRQVYKEIEKLTETEEEQPDKTIVEELYAPFVLVALVAYLLGTLLAATYFMKVS